MHDPNCTRCPLAQATRAVCIPGDGPFDADIMLVGEAPGADEEATGKPFQGRAGQELNRLLSASGLSRDRLYVTNTTRCRPPGNRAPEKSEQEACRIYTVRELETVRPKVIVAIGGSAALALTGHKEVGKSRGRLRPLLPEYRVECPVVVTYHPAAYMHNPKMTDQYRTAIIEDLKFAQKAARPRSEGRHAVSTVGDARKAVDTIKALSTATRLACDAEWTVLANGGGSPWSKRKGKLPQLVCVGLAGEVNGELLSVSVPAEAPWLPAIIKLLNRIPSIYHNAPADLPWLYSVGAKPILGGDTLLLASLLNIDTSISLEVLAGTMTTVWKGSPNRPEQKLLGRMPVTEEEWERVLRYNGEDCIATLLLEPELLRRAEETGRESVLPLYRELLRSSETLTRTALLGIPFDLEQVRAAEEKTQKTIDQLRQGIADELNVPGFVTKTPKSIEAVAYAIERLGGFTLPRTKKTRKPSLSGEALMPHARKHPVIADYVRLTRLQKLEGTYLTPWRYLLEEQGDGRIHTNYKLWVARTGRSSAEHDIGGTLQQVPRSPKIRAMVKTADEEWVIISADQGQVELRIGAWAANEPTMLRFFQQGIDPHTATAAWLKALQAGWTLKQFLAEMPLWMGTVTKNERQAAKGVNFGFLYGMREKKFIATARKDYRVEFTMEEATVARDGYFALYSGFTRWHQESWRWVNLGYVDTPLGRRRPLLQTDDEDEEGLLRKAVNTPVQATASDLSVMALWDIEQEFEGRRLQARVVGFIHDAGMFEVHLDDLEEASAIIKQEMEHPRALLRIGIDIPVPLEVELKVGQSWS